MNKSNYMDIDSLIEKVSKLPIPDNQKADLLRKFKENMMNPDRGEKENLNRIQSKYTSYPTTPTELLPSINPYLGGQMPVSSMAMMMPPQQLQQQQGLTVAHYEVLKNKMDSIQLELVDLLRHVKDYTQRYMNATRQQDMEKIDAYINGLFEVDKQMKRAEEQAAAITAEDEAEATEAGPEKSTITRATDGIKNFLGSIGDGVSGITSFVSNTANIVNDTLSKKVIGGTTPSGTATSSGTSSTSNTASIPSKGNIVSVDDYIQSNMNQINNSSSSTGSSLSSSGSSANPNNITSSNNINAMAQAQSQAEVKKEPLAETAEGNQEEITNAINQLNDTMNADIANTVSKGAKVINPESQSGGGRQENHLTKKIHMLRLRLTKKKLEEQLLDKHNRKTKNKITNRTINKIANKKDCTRTKKHIANQI